MEYTVFQWTPENEATLKEGWFEGLTTLVIAAKIGTTKNSVCGKLRRLNLIKRHKTSFLTRKKKHPLLIRNETHPLLDIKSNQCVFPSGDPGSSDFSYCGDPKIRGSYCQEHYDLTHKKRIPGHLKSKFLLKPLRR